MVLIGIKRIELNSEGRLEEKRVTGAELYEMAYNRFCAEGLCRLPVLETMKVVKLSVFDSEDEDQLYKLQLRIDSYDDIV